jgi:hypothetical protein
MGAGASSIARCMTEEQKSTVRVAAERMVDLKDDWEKRDDNLVTDNIDALVRQLELGPDPLRQYKRIVGFGHTPNHWITFCLDVPSPRSTSLTHGTFSTARRRSSCERSPTYVMMTLTGRRNK